MAGALQLERGDEAGHARADDDHPLGRRRPPAEALGGGVPDGLGIGPVHPCEAGRQLLARALKCNCGAEDGDAATVRELIAAALFVLLLGADALAQRTIVLVRHAERLDHTDDTPLSPAGLPRATALADLLRSAGVTEIVATEFRRTQSTAAPLAKQLGLTPEIIKALEVDALVARLRRASPDAVMLVVGHSNTLPMILTASAGPASLDPQRSRLRRCLRGHAARRSRACGAATEVREEDFVTSR